MIVKYRLNFRVSMIVGCITEADFGEAKTQSEILIINV
ncbi:hypothetical protein VV99796_02116 [Vibrio vulnificus]|nr:hypothetical protein VV99796_02116 [Vibrio vulnificus]OJI49636.1 hypothetical protein VVS316_01558 [Vibrio vulnificus]OJI58424.1 hypothetical protein VFL11327_01677 [Vibrio fluvialis]OJI59231.1 hypothetical protein VV1062A_00651 [Vibrio vulnificus]